MNNNLPIQQWAQWTVRTVQTVHHPTTAVALAWTVRLPTVRNRPSEAINRPTRLRCSHTGQRGSPRSQGDERKWANGSFPAYRAGDRHGNSRTACLSLLRLENQPATRASDRR